MDSDGAAIIAAVRLWLEADPRIASTVGVLDRGRTADSAEAVVMRAAGDQHLRVKRFGGTWQVTDELSSIDGTANSTVGIYPTYGYAILANVVYEAPGRDWGYWYHTDHSAEWPFGCCSYPEKVMVPGLYEKRADDAVIPLDITFHQGGFVPGAKSGGSFPNGHTPIYEMALEYWEYDGLTSAAPCLYGAIQTTSGSVNFHGPAGPHCVATRISLFYRIVGSDACPITSVSVGGPAQMGASGSVTYSAAPAFAESIEGDCGTGSMAYMWRTNTSVSGNHCANQSTCTLSVPPGTPAFTVTADIWKTYNLNIQKSGSGSLGVATNAFPFSLSLGGPASVVLPGTVTWSAVTTGGSGSTTYVWRKNGSVLSGCTGQTCSMSFSVGTSTSFRLEATATTQFAGAGQTSASAAIDVTVNAKLPPTVSVTGPQTVSPSQTCTWTANASGGTPPYSYSWAGRLSGSSQMVMGSPLRTGNLFVTVTDAVGRLSEAQYPVEVMSDYTGSCSSVLYLADLPGLLLNQSNVHAGVQFGGVYWQSEVWMAGVRYFRAIGMHAPSTGVGTADFQIPSGARYFRTVFGFARQDGSPCSAHDKGSIYVDDQLYWSYALSGSTASTVVDVPQITLPSGARVLRLEVDALGDHGCAHTTWGDPYFSG